MPLMLTPNVAIRLRASLLIQNGGEVIYIHKVICHACTTTRLWLLECLSAKSHAMHDCVYGK